MQEDKISKLIAQKLKQSQETVPQPFDLGAWEAFQQKRNVKSRPLKIWWISGIAASIVMGAIGLSVFLSDIETNDGISEEGMASLSSSKENSPKSKSNSIAENPLSDSDTDDEDFPIREETPSEPQGGFSKGQKGIQNLTQGETSKKIENTSSDLMANVEAGDDSQPQQRTRRSNQPLQALSRDPLLDFNSSKLDLARVLADLKIQTGVESKMEEYNFPPILPEKSKLTLGLGVSQGFGASEQNGNSSANSSLGMGFLVAMDLPGKLSVGSGLGINVFNQQNQLQTPPNVAFASSMSPVQEQLLVRQTQLDIPVYFQYPITGNESVSIQAGFSNFISLNQVSELESSFTRQVPVSGQDALLSNSFQLRSESVVQSQQLASPPEGKFYPFATMNFGVNLRVLQSDRTDYILMPFYHLPVNQFTGFGDNPSFFGASFKVRFGGLGDQ